MGFIENVYVELAEWIRKDKKAVWFIVFWVNFSELIVLGFAYITKNLNASLWIVTSVILIILGIYIRMLIFKKNGD